MSCYFVDEEKVLAEVCKGCPIRIVEEPSFDSPGCAECPIDEPELIYDCGAIICKNREEAERGL